MMFNKHRKVFGSGHFNDLFFSSFFIDIFTIAYKIGHGTF